MTGRIPALVAVVSLLGGSVSPSAAPVPVPPVLVTVEASELPMPSPSPSTTSAPPDPPAPPPVPVPQSPARDEKPACGVARPEVIERWIDQASAALVFHGEAPLNDREAVRLIIAKESSGDPCAINLWDSNWVAGHPSKGLIQAIDSTFAAYFLPGYGDIWHPVDSIVAGMRYARSRYGSESSVPGVRNMRAGNGYVGY